MLCEDFDILDVVEDDRRQGYIVDQHDSPGDEDAVAADAGTDDSYRASQHCKTLSLVL